MTRDPIRTALQTGTYVLFYILGVYLLGPVFSFLGGYLVGLTVSGFIAAAFCNALSMKIHERRGLSDIGLHWNDLSWRHLGIGIAVGALSACIVLAGPLLFQVAHLQPGHEAGAGWRAILFVPLLLLCGAAGEEMLFHGFAFQILVRALGPFATILPVGVIFAVLHAGNPNASALGMINTAGFGVLFGCAFLRSRDLWLPMGLHLGWNVTLPLFGVSLSGITMRITGYEMAWNGGVLWSGGAYGPEASILTSGVLLILLILVWMVPIHPQRAYLLDSMGEEL